MSDSMRQVVQLWWRQTPLEEMLVLALVPVIVTWLMLAAGRFWRLRDGRVYPHESSRWRGRAGIGLRWSLIVGALAIGLHKIFARASLFDDAFIAFRYSRNFAEGHGLVFNIGERVEGYTNFLWTLILGLLHRWTPLEVPELALILGPLCFCINLLVVARLGQLLTRRSDPGQQQWHLPLAVVLLALHGVFTDYGTSGLETGAASLWVNLGILWLVSRPTPIGAAVSGSMFIAATLTRPDHGLFYALGGLVVLTEVSRPMLVIWRQSLPSGGNLAGLWRAGGRRLVAYAAPFSIYGVYLLWKLAYYGDIVPNTYYAKSVALAWFSQGWVYAAAFYLGTQAWAPLLLAIVWLCLPSRDDVTRRFKLFFAGSFVIYNLYVAKLGGDFMYGRFYVTLVPLYLLAAEALVHQLADSKKTSRNPSGRVFWRFTAAAAAVGLLAGSTQAVTMIQPRKVRWRIADEATYHFVKTLRPLSVDHHQEPVGKFFRRVLKDRGLEVVLGTGGPGTVGYHSRLEVIDVRGLTDSYVARQPISKRARPGHEKLAPREYLLARGVHLLRTHAGQSRFHPRRWRRMTRVGLGQFPGRDPWQLAHYDRQMMDRIRELAPELRFVDFENWLDRYIEGLPRQRKSRVRHDLEWIRSYYFDHNEDPERLDAIESYLGLQSSSSVAELPIQSRRSEEQP